MIASLTRTWQVPAERARLLLLITCAVRGMMTFSILSRFPTIQHSLRLDVGNLGAILAAGSLCWAAVTFLSSWALRHWGSGWVHGGGTALLGLSCLAMGLADTPSTVWLFAVANAVGCIGGALVNAVGNIESARIERRCGRSVIPHFHAAMSAGAVFGSLVGAGMSSARVSVAWHFGIVAVITCAVMAPMIQLGMSLPTVHRDKSPAGATRREQRHDELSVWREPRTLVIGLIAFAAMVSDVNASNWISVAFVQNFGVSEASGGLALGVFIGSMTLVRLVGPKLIDIHGRRMMLVASCVLGIAGVGLFAMAGSALIASVGVMFWGAATALCFPITVTEAARDPRNATARVSAVAFMSSVASPISPLVLGALVGVAGLKISLLVMVAGMFLIALAAVPFVKKATVHIPVPNLTLAVAP